MQNTPRAPNNTTIGTATPIAIFADVDSPVRSLLLLLEGVSNEDEGSEALAVEALWGIEDVSIEFVRDESVVMGATSEARTIRITLETTSGEAVKAVKPRAANCMSLSRPGAQSNLTGAGDGEGLWTIQAGRKV
ncbi:hypothetical protein PFICI_13892 [Pestalotiopsis fici W106-1]|uniref:Uncharacterized protein n=1 Tax=Pestalotiopsis fici (strain W106-1 / CGMCC3.15140) TaxID=1229662 RepID=W3WMH8_PESFW|nr:uncharacterized protein PFICI_13892 [Pestalotiopsis fici W106-1]ETS74026.1 hypothetical protein PFICI_13892 [Pestalotiopsis fici W106-1]